MLREAHAAWLHRYRENESDRFERADTGVAHPCRNVDKPERIGRSGQEPVENSSWSKRVDSQWPPNGSVAAAMIFTFDVIARVTQLRATNRYCLAPPLFARCSSPGYPGSCL